MPPKGLLFAAYGVEIHITIFLRGKKMRKPSLNLALARLVAYTPDTDY